MSIIKNNLFMLQYVWKYNKSMMFLKLFMSSLGALYTFIDIYFIKWIFDALESKESITFIFAIIIAAGVIHIFVSFSNSIYNNILQPKMSLIVSEKINNEMIDKAQTIDLSCYENAEFFDKYTRALAETDGRVNGVLNTFSGVVSAVLNITVIISLIATIDYLFIIFGVLASALVFLQGILFNKISFNENQERTPFNRKQGYVKRVIYQTEYAKEIKLYQSICILLKTIFKEGKNGLLEITRRYGKEKTCLSCLFAFCQLAFENLLPWFFIAKRTFSGLITIGSAAAIFNATNQLPYALNGLFNIIPQMHQHSLYINNLKEILNYKSSIETSRCEKIITYSFEKIKIDNLFFSYRKHNETEQVLKNVSLEINRGEKIALVGENGSGKTTLLKLLTRLYDPDEGVISVDDIDIKRFDVHKYRNLFSLCFQDYKIYAMTIAENVLMRKPVTKDDYNVIESVLKQVGLYEKIRELPGYLDTVLTKEFDNNGIFLSGGETQRLVIARALASESQILILDEPSSALDPIAEYEINRILLDAVKEKTVILISHRLSTTVDADRIYCLHAGEVIEHGTHIELMRFGGEYARMFKMQAEKYLEANKIG